MRTERIKEKQDEAGETAETYADQGLPYSCRALPQPLELCPSHPRKGGGWQQHMQPEYMPQDVCGQVSLPLHLLAHCPLPSFPMFSPVPCITSALAR